MSLMRVWDVLGKTNHAPTQTQNQAKCNEYTKEERVKMGRYGAENGPSKVTKHFSLLLDSKLTCCSGYVI